MDYSVVATQLALVHGAGRLTNSQTRMAMFIFSAGAIGSGEQLNGSERGFATRSQPPSQPERQDNHGILLPRRRCGLQVRAPAATLTATSKRNLLHLTAGLA